MVSLLTCVGSIRVMLYAISNPMFVRENLITFLYILFVNIFIREVDTGCPSSKISKISKKSLKKT